MAKAQQVAEAVSAAAVARAAGFRDGEAETAGHVLGIPKEVVAGAGGTWEGDGGRSAALGVCKAER